MSKDFNDTVIYKYSNKTIVMRSTNQLKKFNSRQLKKNKKNTAKILTDLGSEIMLFSMKSMHSLFVNNKKNRKLLHLKKVLNKPVEVIEQKPVPKKAPQVGFNLGDYA